ncbi:MAG: hypothetical protein M9934_08565 [Thermomicrobiales bacterium]|nr:hypothetical protein [Thermomicrobiales bacterium]
MMSHIVSVETAITTTQLARNILLSDGASVLTQQHVIVRITDADGMQGYGEASPLTFLTGETVTSTVQAIEQVLTPFLIGLEAMSIASIHRSWEREVPGHRAAKCAIDVALHDLTARQGNLPIAAILGGRTLEVIPAYKAIGIGLPDDVTAEALSLLDLGVRSFKLKIGETPERDLESLRSLREVVGWDCEISVDVNQGYTQHQAIDFLGKAAVYNVSYVEQPVPANDIDGLKYVRSRTSIPVMADEAVFNLRDASRLIQANAVDLIGIKLIKTAGLYHARQIAAYAEEFGVGCVVISPFETEIGVAVSAHFAATLPNTGLHHGLGSFLTSTAAQDTQLNIRGGEIAVPTGPGIGLTPSESLFPSTTIYPHHLNSRREFCA